MIEESALAADRNREVQVESTATVSQAVLSVAPRPTPTGSVSSMPASKRILFVAASPKYGGTEKHLLDLIERLEFPGLSVSILCTGEDVFTARLNPRLRERVRIERRPSLTGFWSWVGAFRDRRPDTVVLVKSWTWCFPWYALLAAWVAGVHGRYAISHLPPSSAGLGERRWLARWRYRLSHRRLALFCNTTICVSDSIRNHLVSHCGFPARRTVAVRNGISLRLHQPQPGRRAELRHKLDIPDDLPALICIASLVDQKRVDVLLEALVLVKRSGACFICIVLGDGPLREALREQAESLGLMDVVRFEGFRADVRDYLWAGDMLVLTSDSEGLPLSVLEAMACGLTCVATDVGGTAEAVLHGECGLVVPPGSPSETAKAISYLIEHPESRSAMAKSAWKRVQLFFDIERSMNTVIHRILA